MPVPFDRPSFDQIMYALKCSGECGDILCTHAAEEIERLQRVLKRVVSEADCAMDYSGVDAEHTLQRVLNRVGKMKCVCEAALAKAEETTPKIAHS